MSQKLCLSLLCLLFLFSCKKDSSLNTPEEKTEKAAEIWNTENAKHGFNHSFQGTPKAMTLLDEIIALDPNHCDALRELSVAYLKRGMPYNWKPQFDKAVVCNPKIWQPWRGYLYLWFYRDYKKAIADFNASDTLTPNFIDAPQGHSVDYWRGIAYLGLNDYKNSIYFFDKYINKEIEDSGEDWVELTAFLYRGIAYYENNNLEEALKNFDKQIHYAKQTADGKYYKALILHQQDKNEKALEVLNEAIIDFNDEFFNERHYVETLRQIYIQDLEQLKETIELKIN